MSHRPSLRDRWLDPKTVGVIVLVLLVATGIVAFSVSDSFRGAVERLAISLVVIGFLLVAIRVALLGPPKKRKKS